MFNFYMKSYFDFTWLNWGFSPPTVRGSKPGKNVQLQENEIRGLCLKSREIFLSQPILLELEAPLKICGKFWCTVTFGYVINWLSQGYI